MERAYMKARDRSYAQRRAAARQHEYGKMERFEKKIIIQCIASLIIFALLWGARSIGGGFGEYMQNKIAYALTYNIDFQDLYHKTIQIGQDAAMLLVEKPDNSSQDTPASSQPKDSTDEPTTSESVSPTEPSSDTAVDGILQDTTPSSDGDDLLSD